MSVTLAARLRAETSALHRQAESTLFMQQLLGGRLDRSSYCLLLRNLEPLYSDLEQGLSLHAGDAAVAPVYLPEMFRTRTLQLDLQALYGSTWAQDFDVMPSVLVYTERLRELGVSSPALLSAHAYVRYLGDLSGGQMLRDIVVRSLQLAPPGKGTAFYEFGPPSEVAGLALALRSGLNEVARDEAGQEAIVAESKWAFEMHCRLFDELSQACLLRPLQ